jgi:cysteine sulfinate desulfinase/cysteine desulfurase-like protein
MVELNRNGGSEAEIKTALEYLESTATTKISDLALAGMLPFLREQYGNASSLYSPGIFSRQAIEHARCQVAAAIGADESSHVLLALGLSPEQAKSTIRISYGRYNNIDEAKTVTDAIRMAYGKITGAEKLDK